MEAVVGVKQGVVLTVDDDAATLRHIGVRLAPIFDLLVAQSVSEAREQLAGVPELAGAIIGASLPDGTGLEVAQRVRGRFPDVPLMVLADRHDPNVINRVAALDAAYVAKTDYDDNLSRFLREMLVFPERRQHELRAAITRMSKRKGLSPRESEILSLVTSGVPRSQIARVIGVSENTIKTQVRSLLDKCGETSLADVAWKLRSPLRGGNTEPPR